MRGGGLSRVRWLAVAVALALLICGLSLPRAAWGADTASLSLSKEVFEPGTRTPLTGPVTPGQQFDYSITVACSGLTQGCINAKTVDVIPAGVTIEVPASEPPLYTVAYDAASRTLTVTYTDSLASPPNPAGSVGLNAGSARDLTIRATVDPDVTDGEQINNTAKVTANNASPASGSAGVTATVPAEVRPAATKSFSPDSMVAQSHAATSVTLGAVNNSSSTAKVTILTVGDQTPSTWDDFDLTGVGPVTRYPAGANQVAVAVCTQSQPCTAAQFITSPPQHGPSLTLPSGVDPSQVTGVAFIFSNSLGTLLVDGGSAGSVGFQLQLRDTVRSTGETLNPDTTLTQQNCAEPSAVDVTGTTTTGADACAPYSILSATPQLAGSKQFFADASRSYTPNGYAVAGQHSGVTALSKVTNVSAFYVASMTITEPSTSSPSALEGIDVNAMRLVFPDGARTARGSVTCADGSIAPFSYTAPPTTVDVTSTGCPSDALPPTKVTVTFAGSIPPDATGQLGVHGELNDTVAGGTTLTDCADGEVTTDSGAVAHGTACADLAVQNPRTTVNGTKTTSGASTGGALVQGQPLTYIAQAANNGNLPQTQFTLTDPNPDATAQNPFEFVRLVSAKLTTTPAALASSFALEVLVNGTWRPYDANDPALLAAATGVRARLTSGSVAPTNTVILTLTVTPRDGVPDGTVVTNCQSTSATSVTGTTTEGDACAAAQSVAAPATAGQVAKNIVPAQVAQPIPGVPPQTAQVRIRAANTGNIPMNKIVVTDPDQSQQNPSAFFDAVNLVSIDAVNFPPGANRVQVDACLSFADCAAGTYTLGTPAATAALPADVDPSSVTGLRFTFTNSGAAAGQYLLNPGTNYPSGGACPSATVCFTVAPRPSLRSAPGTPIPSEVTDIAAAAGGTVLSGGDPQPFGSAPAQLAIVPGTVKLGTTKSASPTQVNPGTPIHYSLTITNPGTGVVPSLLVTEPIPAGLVFDQTFNGDNGQPFTVTSTVPSGTPKAPAPDFTPVLDPATHKVTSLAWQFPADYTFLPGSTITISFEATLAPGTGAGTVVTNTFGATTSDQTAKPKLTCQKGTPDPTLGCTASAQVTARAGNAIDAAKWVHGDDALGFYNTRTGQNVPIDDPSCPLMVADGEHYTRFPCIARTLAGQQFSFLLNITNVGTTPATQTRIVDDLPLVGDKGVIVPGDRDTEWDPRPTFAGPPTLTAGSLGSLSTAYAAKEPGCIDDLKAQPSSCPAGSWDPSFSADDESFRAYIDFSPALQPGQSTALRVPMQAPADLSGTDDDPIAWNSFAHTDFFTAGTTTVQTPAVEPLKVGIAMPFGDLAITKKVTGGLPPGSHVGPFTITYSCVVTTAGGQDVTVATGDGVLNADQTLTAKHIPAGAVCTIGENDPMGAHVILPGPVRIPAAPPGDISPTTAVDVVNDYVPPILVVTKRVSGPGAAHAKGPFAVVISCRIDGGIVSGYPRSLSLQPGRSTVLNDIPVGAECTAAEPDRRGAVATTITYSDGDHATILATSDASITVDNSFAVVPPPHRPGHPRRGPAVRHLGSRLPQTGADIALAAAGALAAIALGALLCSATLLRRRRA